MRELCAIIEQMEKFIGVEHPLDEINYALKFAVRSVGAAAIGVQHVTCSDEIEKECVESFQRCFAQDLLPRLKHGTRSCFRTANVGGRYEWNSLPTAETHFAVPAGKGGFNLMAVKVNAHVAVVVEHGVRRYGHFRRYGRESVACGALHAMFADAHSPALDELRHQFSFEGLNRESLVREAFAQDLRILAAAAVSARLQARMAAIDAQHHRPCDPTVYLILPAVTLNRMERDTEILCGLYLIDRRTSDVRDLYRDVGDDPSHYQIEEHHHRVHLHDVHTQTVRPARDHLKLIGEASQRQDKHRLKKHPRLDKLIDRVKHQVHTDRALTKTATKAMLLLLAEIAPVPAALLLFTQGISGIYHVHRAHRLVRDIENSQDARDMLADLHHRVDHMPPQEARKVLEVLLKSYEGG